MFSRLCGAMNSSPQSCQAESASSLCRCETALMFDRTRAHDFRRSTRPSVCSLRDTLEGVVRIDDKCARRTSIYICMAFDFISKGIIKDFDTQPRLSACRIWSPQVGCSPCLAWGSTGIGGVDSCSGSSIRFHGGSMVLVVLSMLSSISVREVYLTAQALSLSTPSV